MEADWSAIISKSFLIVCFLINFVKRNCGKDVMCGRLNK